MSTWAGRWQIAKWEKPDLVNIEDPLNPQNNYAKAVRGPGLEATLTVLDSTIQALQTRGASIDSIAERIFRRVPKPGGGFRYQGPANLQAPFLPAPVLGPAPVLLPGGNLAPGPGPALGAGPGPGPGPIQHPAPALPPGFNKRSFEDDGSGAPVAKRGSVSSQVKAWPQPHLAEAGAPPPPPEGDPAPNGAAAAAAGGDGAAAGRGGPGGLAQGGPSPSGGVREGSSDRSPRWDQPKGGGGAGGGGWAPAGAFVRPNAARGPQLAAAVAQSAARFLPPAQQYPQQGVGGSFQGSFQGVPVQPRAGQGVMPMQQRVVVPILPRAAQGAYPVGQNQGGVGGVVMPQGVQYPGGLAGVAVQADLLPGQLPPGFGGTQQAPQGGSSGARPRSGGKSGAGGPEKKCIVCGQTGHVARSCRQHKY